MIIKSRRFTVLFIVLFSFLAGLFLQQKPRKDCTFIDFHLWNVFDHRAGWNNIADQYVDLFQYIGWIWFGEGFRYNDNSSENWFVEVSGILLGYHRQSMDNTFKSQ